jgi:RNase H-fold protein (predicted Holliday junction resolvase)
MSLIERQEVLPAPTVAQAQASEDITAASPLGASDNENMKLVPVAESIRYRKRAQSAEKKVEDLTEQLAQVKSQATKISERLSDIEAEQKLTSKLAAAGSVDLETAVLLVKARMEGQTDADLDGVIEQLKKEKQYLFGGAGGTVTAKKTAGAKESAFKGTNNQTVLERAAKKAATTGNRTDLQEYLKLRRNFL